MEFTVKAIGTVLNERQDPSKFKWGEVISTIQLNEEFNSDSLIGLDAFSHVEVLFYFHKIDKDKSYAISRFPKNDPQWGMQGIFAQRNKNRPNKIGASYCELVAVEGNKIKVKALDAIDGTPVIDIKPVFKTFLPKGEIKEPSWVPNLIEKIYW